jgi:hypothetical protein
VATDAERRYLTRRLAETTTPTAVGTDGDQA